LTMMMMGKVEEVKDNDDHVLVTTELTRVVTSSFKVKENVIILLKRLLMMRICSNINSYQWRRSLETRKSDHPPLSLFHLSSDHSSTSVGEDTKPRNGETQNIFSDLLVLCGEIGFGEWAGCLEGGTALLSLLYGE
jgi:hypothetical protein